MRRLLGLRDLVHDAVDAISLLVQETQNASFARTASALSQVDGLREPVRAVDDVRRLVSGAVFDTIRRTNRGVQRIGDGAAAVAQGVAEVALGEQRAVAILQALPGREVGVIDAAQGALNAALGDYLHASGNGLATELGMYRAGRALPWEAQVWAQALPEATPKVCVFVHGLGGTEHAWRLGAAEYHGDAQVSFGSLLEREREYTALYVRYNTGRHVSENGRELADALGRMLALYPGEVREIALVGHSMGGLVARSAAHYAQLQGQAWISRLTHVLCIGSPHTGSFVEKSANVAASLLGAFPAAGTQVPARILNARSSGIKDLRFGYVVDEDWTRRDPDALLTDHRHDVPLVPAVTYGFMAASYVRDAGHPLGALLGDLLVRMPSASGKAEERVRDVPFHIGYQLSGLHHLALLNHPDVYGQLRAFLGLGPARRTWKVGSRPAARH